MLALYFDMSAMPVPDQLRAQAAAVKFIRTQMQPADLMAILSFSDGVHVLQDFTDDRNELENTVDKLYVGEGQGFDEANDDDSSADTGTAFGEDDSEFNLFNTDRQLAALQTAAKMLGTLNEKKVLVYFASGLNLNGTDNQAQFQATVNAATRANVALFTIDARGLVASAPLGDATHGSPGGLRDVHRRLGDGHRQQPAEVAGHAVRAGHGYGRQGAARQQRPGGGHRQGGAVHFQLLHHRLLLDQRRRWTASSAASRSLSRRHLRQADLPPGLLRRQGVQ